MGTHSTEVRKFPEKCPEIGRKGNRIMHSFHSHFYSKHTSAFIGGFLCGKRTFRYKPLRYIFTYEYCATSLLRTFRYCVGGHFVTVGLFVTAGEHFLLLELSNSAWGIQKRVTALLERREMPYQ